MISVLSHFRCAALTLFQPFAVAFWLTLAMTSLLLADLAADQSSIDRLLKAGDFDQAEFVCRERLSDSRLNRTGKAAYTVELLRVFSRHAEVVARDDRRALFESADKEASRYLNADPDSQQRLLVRFQASLLPRLEALLRQCDRPRTASTAADAAVLKDYRNANRQLRLLLRDVDDSLRKTGNASSRQDDRLSRKEMTNLRARILLELGRTYMQQAEAYPTESDDRILAISESIEYLRRLSPASLSPEMWTTSQLELLAGLRLKSDWDGMEKAMRTFSAQRTSVSTRLTIHAELLRASLQRHEWKRLEDLLVDQPAGLTNARLATRANWSLAVVESFLGLARHARILGKQRAADDWERQATSLVENRRQEFGPLWVRRVQSIMANVLDDSASTVSASTNLQAHAAQGLFREGRLREAIAAYDKAAELARKNGDVNQSFEFSRLAAGIVLKSGDRGMAWKRLRSLAIDNPSAPQASMTHLMAIKLSAQGGSPQDQQEFGPMLAEHLKFWPQSEVSDQVHFWQAQRDEAEQKWQSAAEHYLAVRPAFVNSVAAVRAAEQCVLSRLDSDEELDVARETVGQFVDYAAEGGDSQAANFASLAACRFGLGNAEQRAQLVVDLERRLKRSTGKTASGWQDLARSSLVAAHARQGELRLARERLAQVVELPAEDWIGLLEQLLTIDRDDRSDHELREQTIQRGSGFDDMQQRRWDHLRAKALRRSGNYSEASRIYGRLMETNPQDGDANEGVAAVLMQSGDWQAAVAAYRRVAAFSESASDRWFRAKLGIARGLVESGDSQRAAEMIQLLQVLHPKLGGPANRSAFEALLKKAAS